MNILSCFIILLFSCFMTPPTGEIEATYINLNNESVRIKIKTAGFLGRGHGSIMGMQNFILYTNSAGEVQKLKPQNVKEISFIFSGEKVRMISMPKPTKKHKSKENTTFVRILNNGILKLYIYYDMQGGPSNGTYGPSLREDNKYFLEKPNGQLTRVKYFTFKRDMRRYFADCPELAENIRLMKYDYPQIEEVVEFYNTKCK